MTPSLEQLAFAFTFLPLALLGCDDSARGSGSGPGGAGGSGSGGTGGSTLSIDDPLYEGYSETIAG